MPLLTFLLLWSRGCEGMDDSDVWEFKHTLKKGDAWNSELLEKHGITLNEQKELSEEYQTPEADTDFWNEIRGNTSSHLTDKLYAGKDIELTFTMPLFFPNTVLEKKEHENKV